MGVILNQLHLYLLFIYLKRNMKYLSYFRDIWPDTHIRHCLPYNVFKLNSFEKLCKRVLVIITGPAFTGEDLLD